MKVITRMMMMMMMIIIIIIIIIMSAGLEIMRRKVSFWVTLCS